MLFLVLVFDSFPHIVIPEKSKSTSKFSFWVLFDRQVAYGGILFSFPYTNKHIESFLKCFAQSIYTGGTAARKLVERFVWHNRFQHTPSYLLWIVSELKVQYTVS